MGQAPADVKGHIPQDVELPPARAGEHALERRRRVAAYLQLLPGWVYLFIGFVIPLVLILYTSLTSSGLFSTGGNATFTWQWSNYSDAFSLYGNIYIRSLLYAAIATTLCIGLAYPMAYWIAFYGGRWKSTLFMLILVPFFVSFVIRTVQWNFILGTDGLVFGPLKNLGLLSESFHVLRTPIAVIAGITYNFLPFAALPLYVALERIDHRLVEAGKDLYASPSVAFRKVVLPLSFPGIFAAIILTFVPATGDYVNAVVLGGTGTTMIGQIIQNQFLEAHQYSVAAALSVVLMAGMLVIALIYARILGTEDETLAAA
ncbi:MAG TPA: ABC transporter permease [Actinomycetota bacterium]|nr:ABC transporter permease [Actinomycetota bacterium]